MNRYQVVVGNIGMVHDDTDPTLALECYWRYVSQSKSGCGRAGDETVTLFCDDEPVREHVGSAD